MKKNTYMLTVFVLLFCGGVTAFATAPMQSTVIPRLTVNGEAKLTVLADQVELNIGVVTTATISKDALRENSTKMLNVESVLNKIGISKKEYKTNRFQVQPKWSPRPDMPPKDWRAKIVGYTVTNSIRIKTQKLELIGKLIESCAQAGANSIDNIDFSLANSRKYRSEVIEQATKNAEFDAHTLAGAASTKLLRVLSVRLDNAYARPLEMRSLNFLAAAKGMNTAAPSITTGDITVRANVTIDYQIESNKKNT